VQSRQGSNDYTDHCGDQHNATTNIVATTYICCDNQHCCQLPQSLRPTPPYHQQLHDHNHKATNASTHTDVQIPIRNLPTRAGSAGPTTTRPTRSPPRNSFGALATDNTKASLHPGARPRDLTRTQRSTPIRHFACQRPYRALRVPEAIQRSYAPRPYQTLCVSAAFPTRQCQPGRGRVSTQPNNPTTGTRQQRSRSTASRKLEEMTRTSSTLSTA
jgi:hypothetical protein